MTYIIRPIPCLNGDREQTLRDQMVAAHNVLLEAAFVMRQALPHGRNYQLGGDYAADRDEAVRRIALAQDLAELYYQDAIALDKEDSE